MSKMTTKVVLFGRVIEVQIKRVPGASCDGCVFNSEDGADCHLTEEVVDKLGHCALGKSAVYRLGKQVQE